MNSDASGQGRISDGLCVVDSATRRFDQGNTDSANIGWSEADGRFLKAPAVVCPNPPTTIDTQVPGCGGDHRCERSEVGAPILHPPIIGRCFQRRSAWLASVH